MSGLSVRSFSVNQIGSHDRGVVGLVLAETASRMLAGDLREAMATGAEKLLEVGMG